VVAEVARLDATLYPVPAKTTCGNIVDVWNPRAFSHLSTGRRFGFHVFGGYLFLVTHRLHHRYLPPQSDLRSPSWRSPHGERSPDGI
jgi:hypothetical protein